MKTYFCTFTHRSDDGEYFLIRCRDFPEAITQSLDFGHCFSQAKDAIEEAMAGRKRLKKFMPEPSEQAIGEFGIEVSEVE